MHITFILQDMYRLGAQYVTSMIANGLSEKGHQVDVIVSAVETKIRKERPKLQPFSLNENIRKIELKHLKASRNIGQIRNYLQQHHPDVIIPMSPTYTLPAALALSSLFAKTILLPVEHSGGIGMNLKKASKSNVLTDIIGKFGNKLLKNKAAGFISVSKGVKEALIKSKNIPAAKVHVIYNPVVGEAFFQKLAQESSHPWLVKKEIPVVVAAGAHVPIKGYDILVKAIAEVNQAQACRLVLFGEGILTDELKKLSQSLGIEKIVDFPGHNHNLPAELKSADAFVVSSHAESFSVVLVEALASGTPVVATNCPSGPPEILQNGKYGILVEPNNPSELAQGILKVLNGKGINPPKKSWEPYLIDKVVLDYENVINGIVSK
ncbi:MAG: glycosyltransferase [Bacteroidota bacterium]